jgi:hypothetical protein
MSEQTDKVYLEEFRSLVEGEQASAEQFDKGILTTSAGALAISLVFIEKIAPQPLPETITFLCIAWGLLVASLLLVLSSFLSSQRAYQRQRAILREKMYPAGASPASDYNGWGQFTRWLNRLSIFSLVLGVGFLALFSLQNIRTKSHATPVGVSQGKPVP